MSFWPIYNRLFSPFKVFYISGHIINVIPKINSPSGYLQFPFVCLLTTETYFYRKPTYHPFVSRNLQPMVTCISPIHVQDTCQVLSRALIRSPVGLADGLRAIGHMSYRLVIVYGVTAELCRTNSAINLHPIPCYVALSKKISPGRFRLTILW